MRATATGSPSTSGPWRLTDPTTAERDGFDALVHLDDDGDPCSALSVDLGNPHTVVALPPSSSTSTPSTSPARRGCAPSPSTAPTSSWCARWGPGHVAMRVHERGVGETRSCGTGACAAAIATSFWAGSLDTGATWLVDVPGGRLTVRLLPDHGVELAGPAVLVADGVVDLALLPR